MFGGVHARIPPTMRSVICRNWGGIDDLNVESFATPSPAPGEVLVEMRAAGLNTTDLLLISGKHQTNRSLSLPYRPGIEGAGVVVSCGEGVNSLKQGDRVAGSFPMGALAEYAVTNADYLFALPENVPFDVAGALPVSYISAHLALRWNGRLEASETLLTLGSSSGIGLAAVQIGKAMGARVIAGASTDAKCALARENGADDTICYGSEKLKEGVMTLTGGEGVDVCFDPIGGALSEAALSCLGWGGRILYLGFVGGFQQVPAKRLLVKNRAAIGCSARHFRLNELEKYRASGKWLMSKVEEGLVTSTVAEQFSLVDVQKAFQRLRDVNVFGKVVVRP